MVIRRVLMDDFIYPIFITIIIMKLESNKLTLLEKFNNLTYQRLEKGSFELEQTPPKKISEKIPHLIHRMPS